MGKKNNDSAAETKKSSLFKSLLSFVFFVLILASAFMIAVSISMSKKNTDILSVYGAVIGSGFTRFLKGDICFWCGISSVVLWFGLWIGTTKRVASAIRGLGVACTLAPMAVLLCELVIMLLVCAFKVNNSLATFADSLPSQFASTAGDNFIFMLTSAVIASVGIFICKIKRLPKTIEAPINAEPATYNESVEAKENPIEMTEPVPVPAAVAVSANTSIQKTPASFVTSNITDINIDVSDKSISETIIDNTQNNKSDNVSENNNDKSLIDSLLSVCHNCGEKNDPDVKFCGFCGAKFL